MERSGQDVYNRPPTSLMGLSLLSTPSPHTTHIITCIVRQVRRPTKKLSLLFCRSYYPILSCCTQTRRYHSIPWLLQQWRKRFRSPSHHLTAAVLPLPSPRQRGVLSTIPLLCYMDREIFAWYELSPKLKSHLTSLVLASELTSLPPLGNTNH